MKLTVICLVIQAIFLYGRVGCGLEQAASFLGQALNAAGGAQSAGGGIASTLLNAAGGGAPNAGGGIASTLLNAGGFSNAAGVLNSVGGLSNVGNLMSGGGILNMVQNNYLTPTPIKAGKSATLHQFPAHIY